MSTLAEAAAEFARTRKKSFAHDRSKTVGASEIGKCARQVVYGKLGTTPDDDYTESSGFATRGDVMEDNWSVPVVTHWVEKLGGKLLFAGQENQTSFVGKGVPLSATPDGIAVDLSAKALLPYGVPNIGKSRQLVTELKSFDPRIGDSKLPKPEHQPQTMVQLGMFRQATEYRPDYGTVIYVNASDYFDVRVFPVKWSEPAFKSLVKRADVIMKCRDPNQMMPEGKFTGKCGECPFAKRCLGYRPFVADDDPKALKKVQVDKVRKAAEKVRELAEYEAGFRAKKEKAEADLYATLAAVKRNTVIGKDFTVRAKVTASQSRFDTKALAAEVKRLGGDPDKFKKQTKEGTNLFVEFA